MKKKYRGQQQEVYGTRVKERTEMCGLKVVMGRILIFTKFIFKELNGSDFVSNFSNCELHFRTEEVLKSQVNY